MKKLIIIDHEPLSIKRKQIFYIDQLIAKGLDIEFWDCSAMFYPKMIIADTIEQKYKKTVSSLCELQYLLDSTNISNSVFIVETFDIWKNRKFIKLLSKINCYMIRMDMFSNSTLPDLSILEKLKQGSPSKILNAINNKLAALLLRAYKKLNRIKGYDVFISSGNNPNIDVHVNHPDWEMFREVRMYDSAKPYAVFLDEYFPLHPDMQFFVKDFIAEPDIYYKSMRKLFNQYKDISNSDVIIASHPKSQYEGNEFGECQCIKYATASLVKGSQIVFLHISSSLGFAIMADKPLALISTNDYQKTFALMTYMKRISRFIQVPIYNIDEIPLSEIKPRRVEKSLRDSYIYSYLTSVDTQDKSNVDILFNFFSGLS